MNVGIGFVAERFIRTKAFLEDVLITLNFKSIRQMFLIRVTGKSLFNNSRKKTLVSLTIIMMK